MSKGTFFTGQPIFNQILNFIPRSSIQTIVRDCDADRYYKTFKTYEHLVTMLYSIFNHCNTLREVSTGLLAWEHRIQHLGIDSFPRRSTLSDANRNRSHEVFEKIYFKLLARYKDTLPDSRIFLIRPALLYSRRYLKDPAFQKLMEDVKEVLKCIHSYKPVMTFLL
jgi:hypothetical protein